MDSGAADNVMPRRMVRGKFNKIRPSPGQRAGVHYLAANNARIANEGEAEFNFQTAEGDDEAWVFQIAAVSKVLCAVSYLVDHGMRAIFDKDEDGSRHFPRDEQEDREVDQNDPEQKRVDDRGVHR